MLNRPEGEGNFLKNPVFKQNDLMPWRYKELALVWKSQLLHATKHQHCEAH